LKTSGLTTTISSPFGFIIESNSTGTTIFFLVFGVTSLDNLYGFTSNVNPKTIPSLPA
tara:strand:+ start:214 stop:387 length:174 start_codon:yes stop_codon:yes gene_type:complete